MSRPETKQFEEFLEGVTELVYVIRRRPEKTREEFQRYWLQEHGPKVDSVSKPLRALRYVQSHTFNSPLDGSLTEPRGGMTAAYDGITELWWTSLEDLKAAAGATDGQALAMLAGDESTFIAFDTSSVFFTEEHKIFQHAA
jgi:hypothetical protein